MSESTQRALAENEVLMVTSGDLRLSANPLVHFNEVDECAGVDGLITNRVWTALGLDPSNTLHDVRWGEVYSGP